LLGPQCLVLCPPLGAGLKTHSQSLEVSIP
jgi:hypothetical protein